MSLPNESPAEARTFRIDVDGKGPAVRVRLAGELDRITTPALREVLDRLRDDGPEELTVDVAGLQFLDTAGLGEFIRAAELLRLTGGRLVLSGLTPLMRHLLERIGQAELAR
jgi:anti-sigma B factor antagonist